MRKEELKVRKEHVREGLDSDHRRLIDVACQRGASVWFSALPLKEFGFDLHKGSFRDAVSMRFGWQPPQLPTTCVCGKPFGIDHAPSMSNGWFSYFKAQQTV